MEPETTLPQKEIGLDTKPVVFAANEDASSDEKAKIENMNLCMEGLRAIQKWSQNTGSENISGDFLKFSRDVSNLSEISSSLGSRLLTADAGEAAAVKLTVAQSIAALEGTIEENEETDAEIIVLEDTEEIEAKKNDVIAGAHDIRNEVTAISMARQLIDIDTKAGQQENIGEYVQEVESSLKRLSASINNVFDTTKSVYPDKSFSGEEAVYAVEGYLKPFVRGGLRVTDMTDSADLEGSTLHISEGWLVRIASNVAQNTLRSYEAKARGDEISQRQLRIRSAKSNEYTDILFEDEGVGFPEDIVKNGFRKGKTEWGEVGNNGPKGIGVGMANLTEKLNKAYGIVFVPENVTDADGKILGARLRIRFPVTSSLPVG